MRYRVLNIILLTISVLMLSACDNQVFNEVFRNPYVVEIAKIDSLEANKWYEFKTEAKAINKIQEMMISFDGGLGEDIDIFSRDDRSIYVSKKYPGREIEMDLVVMDSSGKEYKWIPSGLARGILFSDYENEIPMGEMITKVKVRGNVDYRNVKITWISRTGK